MEEKTVLKPGQRTCPKCGSDWDGGSIIDTFIKMREEGNSYYHGKTDEEIERMVKGWPEQEILDFIDTIPPEDFSKKGFIWVGWKEGDPTGKEFLLSLPKNERDIYLNLYHDVWVSGSYAPPYRWGREIGIELNWDHPNHYDGVSYWQCPDCKTTFNRFTGIEESINQITNEESK